uniref:Uncharacterized protein n=1 Tax=Nothobranchius kuhntae TaxID=321403 RepID=A0A1A8KNI6_NOTKU
MDRTEERRIRRYKRSRKRRSSCGLERGERAVVCNHGDRCHVCRHGNRGQLRRRGGGCRFAARPTSKAATGMRWERERTMEGRRKK